MFGSLAMRFSNSFNQLVAYFVCQLFGAGQVGLLCVYKRSVDWRGAAELMLIICGFITASNTFTL